MNTHQILIIAALCVACIIIGAWLDRHFYTKAAAAVQKERDQLIADYRDFAGKAHAERDAIASKLGISKSATVAPSSPVVAVVSTPTPPAPPAAPAASA